jgi:hypothetical protein
LITKEDNSEMSLRRGVVAALGRQQLLWAAAQQQHQAVAR